MLRAASAGRTFLLRRRRAEKLVLGPAWPTQNAAAAFSGLGHSDAEEDWCRQHVSRVSGPTSAPDAMKCFASCDRTKASPGA